jgi:NADPH2:quinone reductase
MDRSRRPGRAARVDRLHPGCRTRAHRVVAVAAVDAVIHLAGDPAALLPTLRPGGRFVSTRIASPDQIPAEDATVIAIYANPDPVTLQRVARHHADGLTRVHVQASYPLNQVPAALAAFAAGTLGKLAITIA